MNLTHCHIQVKDMPRARHFYEGVFEFFEDFVCDEDEVFLRNQAGFVLGMERVGSPESLPRWFHFGFDTGSEAKLREVFARVRAGGYAVKREIKDFVDTVNFYCEDPDGNQIEVYCKR